MKAIEYSRTCMFVKPEFTNEMLSPTPVSKDSKIGVSFSLEMLPVLKEAGYTNVTFMSDHIDTFTRKIANLYGYQTKLIEEGV